MTGASIRSTLLLLAGLALAYTAVADDTSPPPKGQDARSVAIQAVAPDADVV